MRAKLKKLLRGRKRKPECHKIGKNIVPGKIGLEIGGPSKIFSDTGAIPLYKYISSLDQINYSDNTIWLNNTSEPFYLYRNKMVAEATDLSQVGDQSYDFMLSSHVLEHVANPLKAVYEFFRILKPTGKLIIVIPDAKNTFDHKRPINTLEHIVHDYQSQVDESDSTHFDEVLSLHDLTMDDGFDTFDDFKSCVENNVVTRCVHHHVFDLALAVGVIEKAGFRILSSEHVPYCHLAIVAVK
jgi:predicted SAM-dependent methyltransferase